MNQELSVSLRKKERVDESYYFDTKATFNLAIQVEEPYLRAVIYNNERQKFVVQAEFTADDLNTQLRVLLSKTDLFQKEFFRVKVYCSSPAHTLIPAELYDVSKQEEYLSFNNNLAPDQLIYTNHIKANNSYIIFALRSTEIALFRGRFPEVKFYHAATPMLESLLLQNKNKQGCKLYLHVEEKLVDIYAIENEGLKLYNQFNYHSIEDFVYYPLFVVEQLGFNPESTEVFISGNTSRTGNHFNILYKYFRHVNFLARNDNFQYAYKLDTDEPHRFFHLYNLELCE